MSWVVANIHRIMIASQGFKGSRVQGFKGSKVQGFNRFNSFNGFKVPVTVGRYPAREEGVGRGEDDWSDEESADPECDQAADDTGEDQEQRQISPAFDQHRPQDVVECPCNYSDH